MRIKAFILERIRIGLIQCRAEKVEAEIEPKEWTFSLCAEALCDERLSTGDVGKFYEYIKHHRTDNSYFNHRGEEDKSGAYHWKPNDYFGRLRWLDKHIKMNS